MTESLVNGAGTKMHDVFAPLLLTASATVSYTGRPCTCWPPFPGVTPATTVVPNSRMATEW